MSRFSDLVHEVTPHYDSGDWRWRLLEELFEKNFNDPLLPRVYKVIPKKIHQIWIGPHPFPEKYKKWAETWKELNPDYEYKLWTDEDVAKLRLPRIYYELDNYGPKSDILRYYILNEYGGVYVDTDFECIKSIDFLSYLSFYAGFGYPKELEIYVGILASVPHHPVIVAAYDRIQRVTVREVMCSTLKSTSSYFFTNVFFSVVRSYQEGVVVFPTRYFYPFSNKEKIEDVKTLQRQQRLKEESFGIHHWEVSWCDTSKLYDWIQGDKFVDIADYVYTPKELAHDDYGKYKNTFNPSVFEEDKTYLIYTSYPYLLRLLNILKYLKGKFVVLAHNGDQHIEGEYIVTMDGRGEIIKKDPLQIPENVLCVYVTNANSTNPKVKALPLGLQNAMWGDGKKKKMATLINSEKDKPRHRLVYMNFNIKTNVKERTKVWELFKDKTWITKEEYNGKATNNYLEQLVRHKYVLTPVGNGLDTHRMWEALYLGCIPIMLREEWNKDFRDLPICFVDDWGQVTSDFLKAQYEIIKSREFDKDKLQFTYWKNEILKQL